MPASIEEIISILKNLPGQSDITLKLGAREKTIKEVEAVCEITLPDDFKTFYRFSDGFESDEDMFNLVPLEEIISHKHDHPLDPIYIAEYMIYCDMWQLEINPADSNDYKIIIEANDNKLVLTKSLAEFIARFLKGGLYDEGGLIDWQQQVGLLPIYSTKIKTAAPLLTVFFYGLKYGFITKKEVTDWADELVAYEDQPENYFIELSLAKNRDELISHLHAVHLVKHEDATRAMLGILYNQLNAGQFTIDKVIAVINNHEFADLLTRMETLYITGFKSALANGQTTGDKEFTKQIINFLSSYKPFEISNYKNWIGLSQQVKYKVTKEG